MKNENEEKQGIRRRKKAIIGLSIATGILGASTLGLAIAYGVTQSYTDTYSAQLENIYQKNLYDLVEGVNNIETKLSKVLSSSDTDYQNKTLVEVAHNTELAQQSISGLPISQGSFTESVRFINQVGGYTETLSKKLAKGQKLSESERETLSNIRDSMASMKEEINNLMDEARENYSILNSSFDFNGDKNSFTVRISKLKSEDLDYPTMIYDGPFSDSQTNVEIKGLSGATVSMEDAYHEIEKCFKDIASHSYEGEINSKIETYNFKLETTNDNTLYAQVSKIGGNVITVSGTAGSGMDDVDMETGEQIALQFAGENGIEDAVCVWKDRLRNQGYFNIAPKQNGIILYPDLVKVKVDLSTGTVIGYDASTYFTNHTQRLLPKAKLTASEAGKILPSEYNFEEGRLVLAPLEYLREVLCYEFVGEKEGSIYYFYINAQTGKEENILKVVETNDGSKLM